VSKTYIQLTDTEGDPIYILNDVTAIYSKVERTTVASMHGPLAETKGETCRAVVSASSGGWHVKETYEEILAKIELATECE
jgi:hypothetical protein